MARRLFARARARTHPGRGRGRAGPAAGLSPSCPTGRPPWSMRPAPSCGPTSPSRTARTSSSSPRDRPGVAGRCCCPAAAVRASAEATLARLGGPGSWLLALPTSAIAGLQVVCRSVLAGRELTVLGARGATRRRAGPHAGRPSLTPRWCPPSCAGSSTPSPRALRTFDADPRGRRGHRPRAAGPRPRGRRPRRDDVRHDRDRRWLRVRRGAAGRRRRADRRRRRRSSPGRCSRSATGWTPPRPRRCSSTAGSAPATPAAARRRPPDRDRPRRRRRHHRRRQRRAAGRGSGAPRHPDVADVVVFGRPDGGVGERRRRRRRPDGGPVPTLAVLRPWVTARLGAPAAPRELHLLDVVPTLHTGKPDRRAVARGVGRRDDHPSPVGRRRPAAHPARRASRRCSSAAAPRPRSTASGCCRRCSRSWSRSRCRSRSTTPTTTPTAPAAPTPTGSGRCGWSARGRPGPAGVGRGRAGVRASQRWRGWGWPRCRAGGWWPWGGVHRRRLDLHRGADPLRLPGAGRGVRLRLLRPGGRGGDDVRADPLGRPLAWSRSVPVGLLIVRHPRGQQPARHRGRRRRRQADAGVPAGRPGHPAVLRRPVRRRIRRDRRPRRAAALGAARSGRRPARRAAVPHRAGRRAGPRSSPRWQGPGRSRWPPVCCSPPVSRSAADRFPRGWSRGSPPWRLRSELQTAVDEVISTGVVRGLLHVHVEDEQLDGRAHHRRRPAAGLLRLLLLPRPGNRSTAEGGGAGTPSSASARSSPRPGPTPPRRSTGRPRPLCPSCSAGRRS